MEYRGLGSPSNVLQVPLPAQLHLCPGDTMLPPWEMAGVERVLLPSPGGQWWGDQSSEGSRGMQEYVKSRVLMDGTLEKGMEMVGSFLISWALRKPIMITGDVAGIGTWVLTRVNKWDGCHLGKAEKL